MPITYVSGATGTTSLTLPAVATASGDILICSAYDSASITDSLTGTYNGGAWTRFINANNGSVWISAWWSRGSEDHQGDTIEKGGMLSMAVTVWRGCLASGSPVDTNTSTTLVFGDPTVTGFNTTVVNTMTVLMAATVGESWSGQTKNSVAMTERIDGSGHMHASLAQAASGATGDFFADQTGGGWAVSGALALKPVPVGGIPRPPHPHRGLVMRYPRR